MKIVSSVLGLILLSPCFSTCSKSPPPPPLTEESAREMGERILAGLIKDQGGSREDYDDPRIDWYRRSGEPSKDSVSVEFHRKGTVEGGFAISFGNDNACVGVASYHSPSELPKALPLEPGK